MDKRDELDFRSTNIFQVNCYLINSGVGWCADQNWSSVLFDKLVHDCGGRDGLAGTRWSLNKYVM